MPLFDLRCQSCSTITTELLNARGQVHGNDAPPRCPTCGSLDLEKLLAPFSLSVAGNIGNTGSKQIPSAQAQLPSAPSSSHTCSAGCSHGVKAPSSCATGTYADSLIKKHLGWAHAQTPVIAEHFIGKGYLDTHLAIPIDFKDSFLYAAGVLKLSPALQSLAQREQLFPQPELAAARDIEAGP